LQIFSFYQKNTEVIEVMNLHVQGAIGT